VVRNDFYDVGWYRNAHGDGHGDGDSDSDTDAVIDVYADTDALNFP
jgi:hypothetical protein